MIIDAHQHVWDLDRSPYQWIGPHVPVFNRTYTFEEARPYLARNGVAAAVLVQADDHDGDTDLMLEVADRHPQVAGIVAYVPLDRPDEAAARLAELRRDDRIVGVRNLIHDLPDPDWILRPEVDEGLGVLESAGVAFDYVAVLARHLSHVPVLSERHPDLRIVIDHLSKPPIGEDSVEPWWTLIARAAENPNVHAKISGLYPGADPGSWTPSSIRPFVGRALELFGPARLMYGGDWPVSVAAGGYDRVFEGLATVLEGLSEKDRAEVYAGTAARFYRIAPARLEAAAAAAEMS
jgi:L-fuconolactonase